MDNIHKYHRQRLKNRYIKEGLENFAEHNCLELLLFYSIQQKDTNPIAHRLIKRFGNLEGVFNASVDELCEVEGISEHSAVLINMISKLSCYAKNKEFEKVPLDSADKLCKYCENLFSGERSEKLKVICFNEKMQIVAIDELSAGTSSQLSINARKVIEFAIKSNSDLVAVSHNHPNGDELPSGKDVVSTRVLKNTLESVNITLIDHVIVGSKRSLSMKNSGYIGDF